MTYLPLKLDIDLRHPMSLADLQARASRANVTLLALAEARSPSGGGWHQWLWIDPPPRTAVEVVALQLLFGSDSYREAYCLQRARRVDAGTVPRFWRTRWNVLYEHPVYRILSHRSA